MSDVQIINLHIINICAASVYIRKRFISNLHMGKRFMSFTHQQDMCK